MSYDVPPEESTPRDPDIPKTIETRVRQNKPKNILTSLLGGAPLEITVKIPEEDKRMLSENVKEMADRMDFRWKRTQQLILLGYFLTGSSFIVSKLWL